RELQAGDLQNAADLVVVAADHEVTILGALEALPSADDQGDPGGVDELAFGEVDQDRSSATLKRPLERLLEVGRRAEVELAADRDRRYATLDGTHRHLKGSWIHNSML